MAWVTGVALAGVVILVLALAWMFDRRPGGVVVYMRRKPIGQAGVSPARCKCGKRIHRCTHSQGVSSTWEHLDGLHFHRDGSMVEHR